MSVVDDLACVRSSAVAASKPSSLVVGTHPTPLRLGLAVVGVGPWGTNLMRAFGGIERARLIAVCDRDEARLAPVPEAIRRETDFGAILRRDEVAAVVIATPPHTHTSLVLAALEAGKDVFVEKPMALTLMDALRIRAAAERSGSRVMVGFVLRYHPALRKLTKMIEEGHLGKVTDLFCQREGVKRAPPERSAWWSLAPHDVSLAHFLFGAPAKHVTARARHGAGDAVSAVVGFEHGGRARLLVGASPTVTARRLTAVGPRGVMVFDDLEPCQKLKLYSFRTEPRLELGQLEREFERLEPYVASFADDEPLRVEAAHFVEAVLDGRPFATDLEHALDVVASLAAGQQSLDGGGARVKVPDFRGAAAHCPP